MKITIWSYLKHWLRFWCGPKLVSVKGEVQVQYDCLVCARRDVKPEVWEARRIESENFCDCSYPTADHVSKFNNTCGACGKPVPGYDN